MKPDLFIQEQDAGNEPQPVELRLATVANYNSTTGSTLIFDGETTPTTKRYKRLYSALLGANQRVLVAKIAGTYIILGRVY